MIIVSDTSPLLNFAFIDKLKILNSLYEKIYMPEAVFNEITKDKNDNISKKVIDYKWIYTKKISNKSLNNSLQFDLDKGESEALTLYLDLNADLLLIDERKAREIAKRLNIRYIGILGVLMEAKNKNIIKRIKPILDELIIKAGFWIGKDLYNHFLKTVKEVK